MPDEIDLVVVLNSDDPIAGFTGTPTGAVAADVEVMPVLVTARTERHGVEMEHRPASVWRVQDGKVVAVHFFLDQGEAVRFAGLDN